MINKIKIISGLLVLVAVMFCMASAVSAEGGGSKAPASVGDFDIKIEQIPLTKPKDTTDIKIVISDKQTKEKITRAEVVMNVTLNNGSSKIMSLTETEPGTYTATLERKHQEFWGSDKITITVEKEGKSADIRAVAPFIGIEPWQYAFICLLSAYVFGYGASRIFGSIKH